MYINCFYRNAKTSHAAANIRYSNCLNLHRLEVELLFHLYKKCFTRRHKNKKVDTMMNRWKTRYNILISQNSHILTQLIQMYSRELSKLPQHILYISNIWTQCIIKGTVGIWGLKGNISVVYTTGPCVDWEVTQPMCCHLTNINPISLKDWTLCLHKRPERDYPVLSRCPDNTVHKSTFVISYLCFSAGFITLRCSSI